ncbi:MAG: hypothetical protein ACR2JF_00145 [Iamia sp.]
MSDATLSMNERLDQAEERLPTLPSKWLHLNRAVAERTVAQNRRNAERVQDAAQAIGRVASSGARTVVGTARRAVEQTASVAATGFRQVTGQAKAQAERTATTATDEVTDLTDEAIERVEATTERADRAHLESLTKAELYDQAQDLDIDGRAGMSKGQLVDALVIDLDAK